MPELLDGATGAQVDQAAAAAAAGEQDFARAMAGPASDSEAPEPPKRPAAPYGYKEDGTPRKAAGRPRKDGANRARATNSGAGVSRETRGAVDLDDDQAKRIREGITGYHALAAAFCSLAARGAKRTQTQAALAADGWVLAGAAPRMAEACVDTARADAAFAALMDKICALGPYAALIQVGSEVGMQLARNHRPQLQLAGTRDPAEILAEMEDALADAAAPAAA